MTEPSTSRKKTLHNTNCCVYKCSSRKNSNRSLHFHAFPKKGASTVQITNAFGILEKMDQRKAWEKALLMGKPVSQFMRVCSLHFQESDYLAKGKEIVFVKTWCFEYFIFLSIGAALLSMNRPKLKTTAVPSRNLPKVLHTKQLESNIAQRKLRFEMRSTLRDMNIKPQPITEAIHSHHVEHSVDTEHKQLEFADLTEKEQWALQTLLEFVDDKNVKSFKDKEIQVMSGDLIISFTSTIKSNAQLNSLTGIPNFEMLNDFVKLISDLYPDKKIHKLTVKDRIILVFMKLKMALRFTVLSFLFRVCQSTVRNVFREYISYLANILKGCIQWPSSDEISMNLPICFENFKNARVILDCTEIPVQRSSCLSCRIRTYSHYKGGQTIKFMTGVSPAGHITFVSACYGGRCSDKAIFEQSNIIEKLEPFKDSIMVDKGFLIEDICHKYSVSLIRPFFLRNKKQFSEKEANLNVAISKARVHIERVNQRMKIFEILRVPLPWTLVKDVDHIILVISAMVNLQNPILDDDKFFRI